MEFDQFILKEVYLKRATNVDRLRSFLQEQDLLFDSDIDYAICIEDRGQIVASGCCSKNILKGLAVHNEYRNYGLLSRVVGFLRKYLYSKMYKSIFLFTKPLNKAFFEGLGFYQVEKTDLVLLMEDQKEGILNFLKGIKLPSSSTANACLIMNCNPLTKGHLYLIEKACKENDQVILFVLEEDRSYFSFQDRFSLIKKGCQSLTNLFIYPSGPYIISSLTFPSYFLKESSLVEEAFVSLDLKIFTDHIAPFLNITKRYVGTEPFCSTTSYYNKIMKNDLPKKGIQFIEVDRLSVNQKQISASFVRKLLSENKIKDLYDILPDVTYDFLIKKNELGE